MQIGKHEPERHDAKTGPLINSAAQRFLKTLGKSLQAKGIIITVEACGCMKITSSLSEADAEHVMMSILSQRDEGESDQ